MALTQQKDSLLHDKLPIDKDEKILAVYRHHWFAYVSNWLVGGFIIIAVMAAAITLTSLGSSDSTLATHKAPVLAAAAIFSAFVLLGTMLPVYLRSQEQVVLTEEALLQVLRPNLFASKIDQLNLQHMADISVRQDMFGTMLGYGHITIETPGEQDNYEFSMLPDPHKTAREITQAHENYDAAMQSGRMPTTLGTPLQQAAPAIDPAQYQQFLQYQQMVAQQQTQQTQQPGQATGQVAPEQPAAPPDSDQPADSESDQQAQ